MKRADIGSKVLLRSGVTVLIDDIESGYYMGEDEDGEGFAFTDAQIKAIVN